VSGGSLRRPGGRSSRMAHRPVSVGREWLGALARGARRFGALSSGAVRRALWVGHDAGVDVLAGGVWRTQTQSVLYGPARVLDLAADRENNIWLATTDGLVRLRRRALWPVPLRGGSGAAVVSVLWVETGGRVWAGLRSGGLAAGDAEGLEPLLVPPDFADVALNALYRRPTHALVRRHGGQPWTLQNQSLQRIEGGYTDDVQTILGRGGAPAWIATSAGCSRSTPTRTAWWRCLGRSTPCLALWLDPNGTLWRGTEPGLASAARPEGRAAAEQGLPGRTIRAIRRDCEGVLWSDAFRDSAGWRRKELLCSGGLTGFGASRSADRGGRPGHLWLGTAAASCGYRSASSRKWPRAPGAAEVRTFGEEAGMDQAACTGGVSAPSGKAPQDGSGSHAGGTSSPSTRRSLPPPRPAPEIAWCRSRADASCASVPARETGWRRGGGAGQPPRCAGRIHGAGFCDT
jgi:hypothetical protein